MAPRTYGELCPTARALDVLGERWTLLVVRELLLGPKRFKDLLVTLPAMGTNRLTSRLRKLQAAGVVTRRTLPPPAGVHVYELTESGERLRPAIYALGAWGSALPLPAHIDVETARAELIALGRTATSPPELTAGPDETYDFRVGHECFHVTVADGEAITRSGLAPAGADLVVECDLRTFVEMATGELTPTQATRRGRAAVRGAPDALARAVRLLDMRRPAAELRLVAI